METMMLSRGFILLLLTGLAGCALFRRAPVIKPPAAPAELESDWRKYHCYVLERRIEINTFNDLNSSYNGLVTHLTTSYAFKALTPEGSQIGTLRIPNFRNALKGVEVRMEDPRGKPIPLDESEISREYRKTGKLLVPKVTEGCVLFLRFRNGPFGLFHRWEIEFEAPVPVLSSVFQVNSPTKMGYEFKEYNGLEPPKIRKKYFSESRTWSIGPVFPYPQIPYADYSRARPRLNMAARNVSGAENTKNWRDAIRITKKEKIKFALFSRESQCRAKALELTENQKDNWDKARMILAFIRDNITLVEREDPISPDHVLESQQGNTWEIAVLLRTLLTAAGVEADILLSRRRELGGFDESFPQSMSLQAPLVIFTSGGRRFVACPENRAYALGDFPTGYFGLKGVSMESGEIFDIPKAVHFESEIHLEQTPSEGGEREVVLRLQGPEAVEWRSSLLALPPADQIPEFQSLMRNRLIPTRVKSFAAEALEDPDRPLTFRIRTEDGKAQISEEGKKITIWENAFSRPFWFYDSSRTDSYWIPATLHLSESFHVPATGPSKPMLPCVDEDAALFRVHCAVEADSGGMVVKRVIEIPASLLSAEAWRGRAKQMVNLSGGRFQFLE